jgi:hypothetical protein
MMLKIQIVDQQQVDVGNAQPLLAVFERPHDAVVSVIEHMREREAAGPEAALEAGGVAAGPQHPADLGGQHELAARPTIEGPADPVLALATPVPGRGVEVSDALVPGRLQGRCGRIVRHDREQVAKRRGPEAQLAEGHPGSAQVAGRDRVHAADLPIGRTVWPVAADS